MPCKFSMLFLEYLRILGTENTAGGESTRPRERRAPPYRSRSLSRGPLVAPLHLCQHPHTSSSSQKIPIQLKHEFQLILLRFSISLVKAPFTKLLWEIVAWYVTPPLVQLVFVLVLYSLQIFAAQVTLFLSLHVKFMWSKVVLMHDMASRRLQEQLLSILLSLIHFYFELLKISEIFLEEELCLGKCIKVVLQ